MYQQINEFSAGMVVVIYIIDSHHNSYAYSEQTILELKLKPGVYQKQILLIKCTSISSKHTWCAIDSAQTAGRVYHFSNDLYQIIC